MIKLLTKRKMGFVVTRMIFVTITMFLALAATAQKQWNILLIARDDMNQYIGCMDGYAKTPHLDALAAKGRLFSNAYAATPACNPSRTAILTGLRPETTGQYTNKGHFRNIGNNASLKTLPQKFRDAGYDAVAGGKIFHAPPGRSGTPAEQSDPLSWTSQYRGAISVAVPEGKYLTEAGVAKWFAEDTTQYQSGETINYFSRASIWGASNVQLEQSGDYLTTEQCASYLREDHDKPFFLALGISKPHQPLVVPQKYFDMYPLSSINIPEWMEDDMKDIAAEEQTNFTSYIPQLARKYNQLKLAHQAYLAALSFADDCIGHILNTLSKSKYADNTIVVFFGDHGFQLGQKNRWEKYSLWKLSTSAPLIIYYPGMPAPGKATEESVSLMDIHATLLDLAGIINSQDMQSVSLVPQLKNPHEPRTIPAVVTYNEGNHSYNIGSLSYLQYANGNEELYDHSTDPLELRNLIGERKDFEAYKKILLQYKPVVKIAQQNGN